MLNIDDISVHSNKDNSSTIVDEWLLIETSSGYVTHVSQLAIPEVESTVYFWMDYLRKVAIQLNLNVEELYFFIWNNEIQVEVV